jgi:hypothetical protein
MEATGATRNQRCGSPDNGKEGALWGANKGTPAEKTQQKRRRPYPPALATGSRVQHVDWASPQGHAAHTHLRNQGNGTEQRGGCYTTTRPQVRRPTQRLAPESNQEVWPGPARPLAAADAPHPRWLLRVWGPGRRHTKRGAERRNWLTSSNAQQYNPGQNPPPVAAGCRGWGGGGEGGGARWLGAVPQGKRPKVDPAARRRATAAARLRAGAAGRLLESGGLTARREAGGATLQCARVPRSTSFHPPVASHGSKLLV